jgi:hypothetical protein
VDALQWAWELYEGAILIEIAYSADSLHCVQTTLLNGHTYHWTAAYRDSSGWSPFFFPHWYFTVVVSAVKEHPHPIRLAGRSCAGFCSSPGLVSRNGTIHYYVNTISHIRLDIVDASGRWLRTLVDRVQIPGDYVADLVQRGRRLSSGIYFCRLLAGDFTATRKMVKLD